MKCARGLLGQWGRWRDYRRVPGLDPGPSRDKALLGSRPRLKAGDAVYIGCPHTPQYFSFNDNADDEGLQGNDLLLIRALYESGVKAGDPPDRALDYLEQLFASR